MLRDIFNAIVAGSQQLQPPGTSGPTAAAGNTGTGGVLFSTSAVVSQTLGHFQGVLNFTLGGPPGTAQFLLSLDGGRNFDGPFTVPPTDPAAAGFPVVFPLVFGESLPFKVPIPAVPASPALLSPGPSGLALRFTGSFNAGDSFSFGAQPTVTWLFGAEHLAAQDSMLPRVIVVPTDDEFPMSEDYALGFDQSTQVRAIRSDVARFEAHCWGLDYDRTEFLRDVVIDSIHIAVQAVKDITGGQWVHEKMIARAGCLYVLRFTVKKPVLLLQATPDTIPVAPPFTENPTQEFDNLDGSTELSTK